MSAISEVSASAASAASAAGERALGASRFAVGAVRIESALSSPPGRRTRMARGEAAAGDAATVTGAKPRPGAVGEPGREAKRRRDARHRRERGSTALEIAVAMPTFLLFLMFGFLSLMAMTAKLQCADVAGLAARAVARGEPPPSVPKGSEIRVEHDGDLVRVTVRMPVRALWLDGVSVEEHAAAMAEPQAAAGA